MGGGSLKEQCRATKANGERCKAPAEGVSGLCWAHSPAHAEQRQRAASKGGKAKANLEVKALREKLHELTEQVISGELPTNRGAVVNQLITTQIKLLEYERRVKETEDLEDRLAAIEEQRMREANKLGGHR